MREPRSMRDLIANLTEMADQHDAATPEHKSLTTALQYLRVCQNVMRAAHRPGTDTSIVHVAIPVRDKNPLRAAHTVQAALEKVLQAQPDMGTPFISRVEEVRG
jgi:predicted PhzF superfamily epimerase YddE/YHI9